MAALAAHAGMTLPVAAGPAQVFVSSLARKTSAPLESHTAICFPSSLRPRVANDLIETSSDTTTNKSTSFGFGFDVVMEPISAMRSTPGSLEAASAKCKAFLMKAARKFFLGGYAMAKALLKKRSTALFFKDRFF
jgi:hypothetical protein